MKAIGSIVMYSGRKDPEMELSPEISKQICDMLHKCTEPTNEKIKPQLGFRGYSVGWEDDNYPAIHIYVFNGVIDIWCFATINSLKDTIGLEKFLEELLSPIRFL